MELKILLFTLAPPVFLTGFWMFTRFVSRHLPVERLFGWRLFSAGGFTAIAGLAVAVYVAQMETGAAMVMVGAVLAAIGLGKFFLR